MRPKVLLLVLLVICVSITACSKREESCVPQGKMPKLDLSTPDRAVKSYWALRTWRDTTYASLGKALRFEEITLSLYASPTRDTVADIQTRLGRRPIQVIKKVNIETESRAVVTASSDLSSREEYRFVLTKEGNKWLIENIEYTCPICRGTGFDITVTDPNKKCDYCGGHGWKSQIFLLGH